MNEDRSDRAGSLWEIPDRIVESSWPRERVMESQRRRLLDAMAQVVAERGLHGATVAAVTGRAFVSRAAFAELFGSPERCFVAVVGEFMGRAAEVICEAFECELAWRDGVLAGLEALLLLLDLEPALARVGLVEAVASPVASLEHRSRLVERLTELIERVGQSLPVDGRPPDVIAEATVESVAGILRSRLIAGQAPPFVGLLGELAVVVVFPYLGLVDATEAQGAGERRSEAFALQPFASHAARGASIPKQLSRANAHLARAVVRYVAKHPGASNNNVARGIGIMHAGQVSRLLARLECSGVLAKQAGGAGRPNAWRLSPYGEQVVRSLRRC